ncbi:uncharacterized protein RJT20DRAFT_11445 [Scheffersomyces xylosifermentans]|uniref:uncharacterized protein n=1 Tax=Scheffersomyces xylosifermentans TaxID=1304137 RepID=UPI00315CF9B7
MALLAKIKCYLSCILVFYTVYLFNYKCVQLKENPLEEAANTVFHPLTHHHNKLCGALDTASGYVNPYIAKTHEFLDEHVHSHPLFKEYKVEDKITCGKSKFNTYVYPYIEQLFKATEVVESHVHDHLTAQYANAKALYEENFGKKKSS